MTALRAALAAFDEGALATLANAGLLRRAARDLSEGKAALVAESDDAASVEADGQRVEIDARGPRAATCSCKALGVCRHRLLAVLLLQAGAPAEPAIDMAAAVDAVPLAAIERWAGRPGWRAALEIVGAPATVAVEGAAVVVSLADEESVRILAGQGLDGIVSRASAARRKPLHAAAMLAARRHFGLALPDPATDPVAAAAELGQEPDPGFLAAVATALEEAAGFALNLAPEPLEERLFALSVSSRADALPRLGRLLRALAAQMRLKRRRSFTFDPDRALETLGTAHALVRALGREGGDRDALHGAHRQDYRPAPALALVGCGAERWRTEAGARGVTGIFYDPAADRWLTLAHARGPGQDPRFDPADAYARAATWRGATLHALANARFALAGAGVSAEGRLSNPQGAVAEAIVQAPVATEGWACRADDWGALEARFADRFGYGLTRRTAPDFAILAPHRFAAPYIDDLAQELVWPVADADGAWIALTVAHGEAADATIDRIEAIARRGWRGQVVVRATPRGAALALTPVAIEFEGRWLSLSLDPLPPALETIRWCELWLRLDPRRRAAGGGFARTTGGASEAALAAAWQRLVDMAESGPAAARPPLLAALARSAAQLDRIGLPSVAARLAALAEASSSANLLPAAYAVSLARGQRLALPRLRLA